MMSEQPVDPPIEIHPRDLEIARLYGAMMDRHENAPEDWGLAAMSVRLYAKRVGLDALLYGLERHGVPAVAERCRNEMVVRQHFFAELLALLPPDDPQDIEKTIEEMTTEMAAYDSAPTSLRLRKFLDRLLRRERALRLGASKTTH
jgi:hypothetical protein